ncbi:expressed unknown protein [Seminavis robusta]|uniref:Uncharacterized protein n=1 Tax=Seminavis robusta TaxID=568900 RepID=A0A9N8DRY9_9STRA|nr:expressed unknown protein [Seminavis robusta]|eukprot:Sro210_g087750.1 n/a (150) ;mRNA; r:76875-77324
MMIPRFFVLPFVVSSLLLTVHGFSASLPKRRVSSNSNSRLFYSVKDEDKPIECFLVFTEDDDSVAAPPQVVCTSQPDEYAWFNGIKRDNLVPTDGVHEHAVQCVEGESPRGSPWWRFLYPIVCHLMLPNDNTISRVSEIGRIKSLPLVF